MVFSLGIPDENGISVVDCKSKLTGTQSSCKKSPGGTAPASLGTAPSLGRFRCRHLPVALVTSERVVMATYKPNAPLGLLRRL